MIAAHDLVTVGAALQVCETQRLLQSLSIKAVFSWIDPHLFMEAISSWVDRTKK
jgi:hypothetical protein